jgi:hypothetical protein
MKGYFYLGLGAAAVAFICLVVYASLLGLYLAFSASVLLGFAVLIVEPAPLVIGIASIFWGVNLAERILAELVSIS